MVNNGQGRNGNGGRKMHVKALMTIVELPSLGQVHVFVDEAPKNMCYMAYLYVNRLVLASYWTISRNGRCDLRNDLQTSLDVDININNISFPESNLQRESDSSLVGRRVLLTSASWT